MTDHENAPADPVGSEREALADLVRLKDGPRDDAYRAEKEAAWARAREVLSRSPRPAMVSDEAVEAVCHYSHVGGQPWSVFAAESPRSADSRRKGVREMLAPHLTAQPDEVADLRAEVERLREKDRAFEQARAMIDKARANITEARRIQDEVIASAQARASKAEDQRDEALAKVADVSEEAVDAMARARYERYDSHFSMPGGLSWKEYKAEDPEGADALYVIEARIDLTAAYKASDPTRGPGTEGE